MNRIGMGIGGALLGASDGFISRIGIGLAEYCGRCSMLNGDYYYYLGPCLLSDLEYSITSIIRVSSTRTVDSSAAARSIAQGLWV